MSTQNQHLNHAADTEPDDIPAVVAVLETVASLADVVHRHRLAVAALKHELAELADELLLREAQGFLVVQGEGKNAEERKARQALMLAADADYQALRRRERDVRRQIAEREADIEKAHTRIRITLAALPLAQAVDALSQPQSQPPSPTQPQEPDRAAGTDDQETP
jgi:hypothetical protein